MQNILVKSTLIALFFTLALNVHIIKSEAAVAVQTEIVSGTILQILDDQSIELDNGQTYHPSRTGIVVNVREGDRITLRYVTKADDRNIFFEFAPGLQSLEEIDLPETNRDNSMQ